jgi:ornithine carbamoyltransferase
MVDASFNPISAESPEPKAERQDAPKLRSLPAVQPDYSSMDAEERPTLSLGGSTVKSLKVLSLGARMRGRSLVDDTDLTPDEIAEVLETAAKLKRMHKRGEPHSYLPGKTLGMIFQHPSTRTRVSFEAGMAQLGGHALYLGMNDLQLRRGETISDTAKVLSRYVDAISARVTKHQDIVDLAEHGSVPVINALSDRNHPCQALADMLTIQEHFGSLSGLKLTYLGDGNNIATSLILFGAAMGVSVTFSGPAGHQPPRDILTQASWLAAASGARILINDDPMAAAVDADIVYTDVHVSMGMADSAARAVALAPYKVTTSIMAAAKPSAVFMHDLPMHRGEEVEAAVADGPQSIIFDQAENRLHAQKALLLHLLC